MIVFANASVAKYAPFGKISEEHYDSIFRLPAIRIEVCRKRNPGHSFAGLR